MNIKENVKDVDIWVRGLFIVIFGVIFYFLYIIIGLLVVFQFFYRLLTGGVNQNVLGFSAGMTRYVEQILLYINFHSEHRPFPFNPWPSDKNGDATATESDPAGE